MWTRSTPLLRAGRTTCQPKASGRAVAGSLQSGALIRCLHIPSCSLNYRTACYSLCHLAPGTGLCSHRTLSRIGQSSWVCCCLPARFCNDRIDVNTRTAYEKGCPSGPCGLERSSLLVTPGNFSITSSWRTVACSLSTFHSMSNSSSTSSNDSGPIPPAITEISSAANPYIKHCVKLRQSAKYRQQQRRLLLISATLLAELADSSQQLEVMVLFMRPDAAPPAGVTAQRVILVNNTVMKKLTGLEEAAGVSIVAELALPEYVDLTSSSISPRQQPHVSISTPAAQQPRQQLQRLLVLEGVQDPGNLGTLLRCAAAFGWNAVWLLPGCCDPFNDKALRASRGAALQVPLAAGSLQQLLQTVKQHDMLLLAAEPEPTEQQQQQPQQRDSSSDPTGSPEGYATRKSAAEHSLAATQDRRPVCLVLGTEGAGLSQAVLQHATPIAVPMTGHMESLNVGVAGAILMFALSDGCPQLIARLQQLKQL